MIYLLDTSAINNLLDHPECDIITKGFVSTNTVYVTALNVAEALATKDAPRRQKLVQFMKRLAKGEDPILLPQELLWIQCGSHANGEHRLCLPLFTQDPLILRAYKSIDPSEEEARELILPWKSEVEPSYRELFKDSRDAFQALFIEGSVTRPKSFAHLLRDHYRKDDDLLYEYASSFYKGACGKKLHRDGFKKVISDLPELLFTLLSYAYSVYARAIQENGHSQKDNPGAVDMWSSVYLPHCDRFVTKDERQRKALRRMNAYNQHPTEVLSHETFIARLLMG